MATKSSAFTQEGRRFIPLNWTKVTGISTEQFGGMDLRDVLLAHGVMYNDNYTGLLLPEPTEEEDTLVTLVEVLFLGLVFFIGGPLSGHSMKKLAEEYYRDGKKAGNGNWKSLMVLRIHLNIADLCTIFIYVPKQVVWMTLFQWHGGVVLCKATAFFSTFSFYLNAFMISAIAVERVIATAKMDQFNVKTGVFFRTKFMVVLAWTFAILFSVPQALVFQVARPFPDFIQCAPYWTILAHEAQSANLLETAQTPFRSMLAERLELLEKIEVWYNLGHLMLIYWFPVITITLGYLFVLHRLHRQMKKSGASLLSSLLCCCYDDVDVEGGGPNSDLVIAYHANGRDSGTNEETAIMMTTFSVEPATSTEPLTATETPNSADPSISADHTTAAEPCTAGDHSTTDEPPSYAELSIVSELPTAAAPSIAVENPTVEGPSSSAEPETSAELQTAAEAVAPCICILPPPPRTPLRYGVRKLIVAKKRTRKQLTMILLAYLAFWTPYYFISMYNMYYHTDKEHETSPYLNMLNAVICVNPIANTLIYNMMQRSHNV